MKLNARWSVLVAVVVAVPFFYGFGIGKPKVPAGVGPDGAKELAEAQKLVMELQGRYVVIMGMFDEMTALAGQVAAAPKAEELQGLDLAGFKTLMTQCMDAPKEAIKDGKKNALDLADAAKQFKNRTAMREAKAAKTALENTYNTVKACPGALKDGAAGLIGAAPDAAKAFVTGRLQVLDNMRRLGLAMKDEAVDLAKAAPGAVAKIASNIALVEGYKKAPGADGGKIDKSLAGLSQLKAEIGDISNVVATDMTGLPAKLVKALDDAKKAFLGF